MRSGNVLNCVKVMIFLAVFAGMSAAGVKNVAVVESDIDDASGASEKISRADVRLVTAELRREAVKNLPASRYNIMTSETVIAQGGAVLEECADENCVISLGSKIGADYIVRGTVSKMETRFTLQVEMYETENGNLVASCDPVRSESIGELIEKAAEACANMYKAWAASQIPVTAPAPKLLKKKSFWLGIGLDAIGAGLLAYGLYENSNAGSKMINGEFNGDKAAYENAKKSVKNRNIGYVVGSAVLLSGISIHIFF